MLLSKYGNILNGVPDGPDVISGQKQFVPALPGKGTGTEYAGDGPKKGNRLLPGGGTGTMSSITLHGPRSITAPNRRQEGRPDIKQQAYQFDGEK